MTRPGGLRRRHVLHAVHGDVDAARQQRFLDLLDEQALAAGLGQRPVLDGIARGLDGDDLDGVGCGESGDRRGQRVRTRPAWVERERAAARAEAEGAAAWPLL